MTLKNLNFVPLKFNNILFHLKCFNTVHIYLHLTSFTSIRFSNLEFSTNQYCLIIVCNCKETLCIVVTSTIILATSYVSGFLVGVLLSGLIMRGFGRKNVLILSTLPGAAGFICIGSSNSNMLIYIGQVLNGISSGLGVNSSTLYIGEICNAECRGHISTISSTFDAFGTLLAYILGACLHWRVTSFLCVCPHAIQFISMCFMPQSPRWLMLKKKETQRVRNAMLRFQRRPTAVERGIKSGKASLQAYESEKSTTAWFLEPHYFKPMLTVVALKIFSITSGIYNILSFSTLIFQNVNVFSVTWCLLISGALRVLAYISVQFIIDKCGRRPLLLLSSLVMTFSLIGLGLVFYIGDVEGSHSGALSLVPLITIGVYLIGFSLGLGPISSLLMGELLPMKVRDMASMLATVINIAISIGLSYSHFPLARAIGESFVFWGYALSTCGTFFFCYFVVPETKGRTIEEIETIYRSDKKSDLPKLVTISTISDKT